MNATKAKTVKDLKTGDVVVDSFGQPHTVASNEPARARHYRVVRFTDAWGFGGGLETAEVQVRI